MRQGRSLRLLILIGLLALGQGCGSQKDDDKSDRSEKARGRSSDLTRNIDCYGGGAELRLTDYRARQIPAEDLAVSSDGEMMTLCDVIKDSGANAAMMQFVSSTCYDCMKWAEKVGTVLAGSDIFHLVVVTDSTKTLDDAGMKRLSDAIAPESTWVRDGYKELWPFFGEGADTTPLLVMMDDYALGFFVDEPETPTAEIIKEANARLGLELSLPSSK